MTLEQTIINIVEEHFYDRFRSYYLNKSLDGLMIYKKMVIESIHTGDVEDVLSDPLKDLLTEEINKWDRAIVLLSPMKFIREAI